MYQLHELIYILLFHTFEMLERAIVVTNFTAWTATEAFYFYNFVLLG